MRSKSASRRHYIYELRLLIFAYWSIMEIQTFRGIQIQETNDYMTLVRAPVESVATMLNQVKNPIDWLQDVYLQPIETHSRGLIALQFRGHAWSIIHELNFWQYSDYEPDAQSLSLALNTCGVYYYISDTAYELIYALYDEGKCSEKMIFRDNEEFHFESQIRPLTKADIRSPNGFADDFFREQDIYIPSLSFSTSRLMTKVTDQLTLLEFWGVAPNSLEAVKFEKQDFERVDYLILKKGKNSVPTNRELAVSQHLHEYQGVEQDEGQAPGFFNRGSELQQAGQHQDAVDAFSEAIRLRSDYAEAYVGRATSYAALRDFQGAMGDFNKLADIAERTGNLESVKRVEAAINHYRYSY